MNSTYSNILCEGDINSLDYKIYKKVFENINIIPCGSNSILKVKELKHKDDQTTCAITDRDTLTNDEINRLKEENIYTLKVRAVENLLVTDEILYKICEKRNIKEYTKEIQDIKNILFNKYGKKLNKLFEVEINENNILEFYEPKKVIDTVSKMLNMSKNDYAETFFEIL